MRKKAYISLILLFGLLSGLNAQNLDGLWKEVYWGPMTSYYYYFNTLDSTFRYYYHDDTRGSFGKGKFTEKGNRLFLKYDSIECDRPIIERPDNTPVNDSTSISFFHHWGFPKRVDIISNGRKVYSSRTSSSDSIIEDYLLIKLPGKLDELTFKIYGFHGLKDTMITSFDCRLNEKPFCSLYYYPSESWCRYIEPGEKDFKIKWKGNDYFDLKGKYKYGFKKIK